MKFTSFVVASLASTLGVATAFKMPDLKQFLDDGDGRRLFKSDDCLEDILDLDFAYSSLDSGTLSTTTPLMFRGVDKDGNYDLELSIAPGSDYVPANAGDNNGYACGQGSPGDPGAVITGCSSAPIFQVNLKQGETTTLRFTLKDAITGDTVDPATLSGGIRFSVFDVDFGSASSGDETYTMTGWETALFDDDAPIEASYSITGTDPNVLEASANQVGRGCDNPIDPFDLGTVTCAGGTVDQEKRSFMVEYNATTSWDLEFTVSGSSSTGRNVLFAFDSELCGFCGGSGTACGGDPHFQRWNHDKRDSFHGECDLVLLHKERFHNGKNLDVHARTTMEDSWSFVEQAAVKIGDDILEFADQHDLYVNGNKIQISEEEPFTFAEEYTVTKYSEKYKTSFLVYLAGQAVIMVKSNGLFYTVTMDGLPKVMTGSKGLLGRYGSGDMIGRHGQLVDDFTMFGFEWQVNPEDPKLFRTLREPQLPFEQCRIPSEAQMAGRRRLRGQNARMLSEAQTECSANHPQNVDSCVEDVMLTGDMSLAEAW